MLCQLLTFPDCSRCRGPGGGGGEGQARPDPAAPGGTVWEDGLCQGTATGTASCSYISDSAHRWKSSVPAEAGADCRLKDTWGYTALETADDRISGRVGKLLTEWMQKLLPINYLLDKYNESHLNRCGRLNALHRINGMICSSQQQPRDSSQEEALKNKDTGYSFFNL